MKPWTLYDPVEPMEVFRPALSLTLISGDDVLVGVRTGNNKTHQNVVSVPTRWIPIEVAKTWPNEQSILRETVNLLALKLGVSEFLESNLLPLKFVAINAWQGISVIGDDLTENITMFNAVVETDSLYFERHTSSYSPIIWVKIEDFLRMTARRDPSEIGLDTIQYCAYGLCLQTTERMINELRTRR